jgi:hypothetical protein
MTLTFHNKNNLCLTWPWLFYKGNHFPNNLALNHTVRTIILTMTLAFHSAIRIINFILTLNIDSKDQDFRLTSTFYSKDFHTNLEPLQIKIVPFTLTFNNNNLCNFHNDMDQFRIFIMVAMTFYNKDNNCNTDLDLSHITQTETFSNKDCHC